MLIEFTFHFFHIEAGHENHFKFQLAIWVSSSHVLLAQGNYLLVIVNDFVRVSCPARKPTHAETETAGGFLEPCEEPKSLRTRENDHPEKTLTTLRMMLTQRKKKVFKN